MASGFYFNCKKWGDKCRHRCNGKREISTSDSMCYENTFTCQENSNQNLMIIYNYTRVFGMDHETRDEHEIIVALDHSIYAYMCASIHTKRTVKPDNNSIGYLSWLHTHKSLL